MDQGSHEFVGYAKMAESTASWALDSITLAKFKQAKWCVTEKIHGANFSLLTDGHSVCCAKRKEILKNDDTFFPGYKKVLEDLSPKIAQLFLALKASHNATLVCVFGELFGGGYPHPAVSVEEGVELIQTGVYYSPGIKFCAFDIRIQTSSSLLYLDYALAMDLLEKTNIFCAKPLHVGTYQSCLDFNVRFESTISTALGLPKLESNEAEGVVIKPLSEITVTTKKGPTRAIVKSKSPKFSETQYHQAIKPKQDRDCSQLEVMKWESAAYVTENRLQSTLSKTGKVNNANGLKLLQDAMVKEIWEELVENNTTEIEGLSLREKEELKEEIQKLTKELMKAYFTKS